MKKTYVVGLVLGLLLLAACAPRPTSTSFLSSSSRSSVSSSVSSDDGTAVQIPASVKAGTGAVRESLLASGVVELGKSGAPHTLLLVTNHACTYCRQFELEDFPRLKQDFINTGLLRYQVVTLPLLKYTESNLFAAALLCGAKQGKGLAIHNSLFSLQPRDEKTVVKLAKQLTLNEKDFTACLHDAATKATLDEQNHSLKQLGITLVPTFVLDEDKAVGLPEYADLRGKINAAIEHGPASSSPGL